MGLFRRSRTLTDRFPLERISALPIALGAAVALHGKVNETNGEQIFGSKFVVGYILGFPDFLDRIDEQFGGRVRQTLFGATYGSELGRKLFDRGLALFAIEDQQLRRGWGSGAVDGERYFVALEKGRDAADAFSSLQAMFEIGTVDVRQAV